MMPNAENYNPDNTYLRGLVDKSGLTQRDAAALIGIDERVMRAYLAKPELVSARNAPYSVQFCLECLAQKSPD